MKKITFLITLLTISISFGQTNLIVNGDFETGSLATGWSNTGSVSYGTDVVQATDVVGVGTAHGGTYVGRALNWGTGATSFLQGFEVTPNETYTVNFWFTFSSFIPTTNVVIRNFTGDVAANPNMVLTPIVPDNGRNAVSNVNYGCGIASLDPNFAWKEAKFSFTVPEGVTKVRFQYYNDKVGYFKYIDDLSVVKSSTASTEDLKQFNFSAYPNPASTNLTISASKNIENVEIFNVIGQKVMTLTPNNSNSVINVSSLNSGVYILKATIEGIKGSYKFVKQ
jgi:hypothetical protein